MIGVGYHFDRLTVKPFTSYKVPTTVAGEVVNGGTNNVWNVGFDYCAAAADINGGVWYIRDPHNSDITHCSALQGADDGGGRSRERRHQQRGTSVSTTTRCRSSISTAAWYIRDPHNSDNHALLGALTTRYFLSKATSLYMQVGAVNNHGRARFGMSIDNALYGVPGTTVGAIVGINKRF